MIVSKFPTPGESKTRLAAKIGNEHSAVLARSMLDDLVERLKGRYRHILVGRECDQQKFNTEYPRLEFVSGGGHSQFGDIHASIRYAFESADTERLIFVTSDSPSLSIPVLEEGFSKLQTHDVVYGASQDGASLIGMKRSSIFHGSDNNVHAHASRASQSRDGDKAAMEYFKSYHASHRNGFHLPMIPDIDSLDDLIHHYSFLRPWQAPKTSEVLRRFATDESFLFQLCCMVGEDSSSLDKRMIDGNECIDNSGPKIGAVIVKNDEIISTGYRFELGLGRHAEDCAIEKAEKPVNGGTLYSTFEPCTYRQSMFNLECCANLISKSGIQKVVYGTPDPQLPNSAREALTPRGVIVEQSNRLATMCAYLTAVHIEKLKQVMEGIPSLTPHAEAE